MKYIQNTYSADIGITIKENGRFLKTISFARYQLDKVSGQVMSDGFTEVEDEDFKLLEKNGAFQLLIKKGKLVVKDKAPLKAGSFEQMLALKAKVQEQEETIAALRAEIAELKGGNLDSIPAPAVADDGLDKLKLDELKAKAKELGLDAEALKKKDEVIKLIREATEKAGE